MSNNSESKEIELRDIVELANGEKPNKEESNSTETPEELQILFDNNNSTTAPVLPYDQISEILNQVKSTNEVNEDSNENDAEIIEDANDNLMIKDEKDTAHMDNIIDSFIEEDKATLETLKNTHTPSQKIAQHVSFKEAKNYSTPSLQEEEETLVTDVMPSTQKKQDIVADPLNKLDNLDAMIDSIVHSQNGELATKTELHVCIESIQLFEKRLSELENRSNTFSQSIEDTMTALENFEIQQKEIETIQQNITLETTELHKKIEEDTRANTLTISTFSTRIESMENHLNSLLTLAKRLNDLETTIQSALGETNTKDTAIDTARILSLEEKNEALLKRISTYEEEEKAVNALVMQRIENLDNNIAQLTKQIEEQDNTTMLEYTETVTTKLNLLEKTVETILSTQEEERKQYSTEVLEKTFVPIIEKSAAQSAARIIREELQALLRME